MHKDICLVAKLQLRNRGVELASPCQRPESDHLAPQLFNCSSRDGEGSKGGEKEGLGGQWCREAARAGRRASRECQTSRQPRRGREGRGSQEGYVRMRPAEPVEDFRKSSSLLPGRQQLNGWSAEETGAVLEAVKGQCQTGFDPPEAQAASPATLGSLVVFGTG